MANAYLYNPESESMQSLEHGRAQHHEITIGGSRDGVAP